MCERMITQHSGKIDKEVSTYVERSQLSSSSGKSPYEDDNKYQVKQK